MDSGSYLRNAQALYNQQAMAAEYLLIREPGLAMFIRMLWDTLGRSELFFVAANGALAGLAVAMAAAAFPEFGSRAQQVTACLVTLFAPVYLVYAGMVLQQTGMAALLSAVCLTLRWITLRQALSPRPFIVLAVLLSVAAYWAALFIYVGAAAAVVLAIWAWRTSRGRMRRLARVGVALSVLAVALLPWLAMQPWIAWKSDIAERRTDPYTAKATLESDFLARISTGLREDAEGFSQTRALSAMALLQVEYPLRQAGIDLPRIEGFADSEDLQWAGWLTSPEAPCGILGLSPEGRQAVLSWVDLHCRHWSPMGAYARLSETSYYFGALASALFVGFTIWSAVRRPSYLVVLAVPWAWLGLYALAGAAIDRYAVPVWPLKTYLLVVFVLLATTRFTRRLRTARGQQEAAAPSRTD